MFMVLMLWVTAFTMQIPYQNVTRVYVVYEENDQYKLMFNYEAEQEMFWFSMNFSQPSPASRKEFMNIFRNKKETLYVIMQEYQHQDPLGIYRFSISSNNGTMEIHQFWFFEGTDTQSKHVIWSYKEEDANGKHTPLFFIENTTNDMYVFQGFNGFVTEMDGYVAAEYINSRRDAFIAYVSSNGTFVMHPEFEVHEYFGSMELRGVDFTQIQERAVKVTKDLSTWFNKADYYNWTKHTNESEENKNKEASTKNKTMARFLKTMSPNVWNLVREFLVNEHMIELNF